MLAFRFTPMMTLNGCQAKLELHTDRLILYPTGWKAKLFPLIFGEARMVYLDEVNNIWLCPLSFQPTFKFKIVIDCPGRPNLYAECLETEYVIANQIIDYIENFTSQSAFLPPAIA